MRSPDGLINQAKRQTSSILLQHPPSKGRRPRENTTRTTELIEEMKVWAKAIFGIAALVLFVPEVSAGLRAEVTRKLGVDCVDSPSNWNDSDGNECKDCRRYDWCGAYGGSFKNFGTASQVSLE